jgi:hypothetical protein
MLNLRRYTQELALASLLVLPIVVSACARESGVEDGSEGPESVPLHRLDSAPATVPSATIDGTQGLLIYSSWLIEGRIERTQVAIGDITEQAAVATAGETEIELDTQSVPLRVDIREYDHMPEDDGAVSLADTFCTATGPECVIGKGDRVTVKLTPHPKTTVIFVNAGWYLAEQYHDDSEISAAWMFSIAQERQ